MLNGNPSVGRFWEGQTQAVGGVEDRRGEDSADARGVRAAEETTATRPGGRPSRRSPLSQTNSGRTGEDEEGAAYQKERAPPTCSLEPQSQNHPTSQSHANLPPKPSAPSNHRRKLPSPSKPCGFADGLATGKKMIEVGKVARGGALVL